MASNLYINEFADVGLSGKFAEIIPAPYAIPIATQQVSISAGSLQSNAFNSKTRFVMLNASAACSLAWGANPTAVATAERMSANETRFYAVNPGQKLAVITNADT